MGTETIDNNEVYVHFGRVVLVTPGTTQYMSPEHALALAKELRITAKIVSRGLHVATRRIEKGEAFNVSNLAKKRIII
jgi:sialic acid synthase SpsE